MIWFIPKGAGRGKNKQQQKQQQQNLFDPASSPQIIGSQLFTSSV